MRKYLGFAGMQMDEGLTIKGVQRECAWEDCCFYKRKSRPENETASWESMLYCAPAVQQVGFTIHRPANDEIKHYNRVSVSHSVRLCR